MKSARTITLACKKSIHLFLFFSALSLPSCFHRSANIQETAEVSILIQGLRSSIEELKQDIHTSQMQHAILEAKITAQETISLQNRRESEKLLQRLDRTHTSLNLTEEKVRLLKESEDFHKHKIEDLYSHSSAQDLALSQYQAKINMLSNEKSMSQETHLSLSQIRAHINDLKKIICYNLHPPLTSYDVLAGDSLEKISEQFDCTITEIKTLNHIENEELMPGLTILIPEKK